MKTENKRVFISDLPETSTQEELESSFSKYGQISSVEIKERKELGPHNKSLFFAYINLNTDDQRLNQCFKDLMSTKWHGQYVQLQIARESFLERLRRERQEAGGTLKHNSGPDMNRTEIIKESMDTLKPIPKKNYTSPSDSGSSDSDSAEEVDPAPAAETVAIEEPLNIVIKSNKNKHPAKGGLIIPSVGKSPIAQIDLTRNTIKPNDSIANQKRLQSLREMKKGYATQKSLIKSALLYGATKPNKKIIFDVSIDGNAANKSEKMKLNGFLFNESDSDNDSDFEAKLDIKEQFEGEKGQKLLELQMKYNSDKRFNLDKRFIEDENPEAETVDNEDNLDSEKNKQLKILEEVLGKKLTSNRSESKANTPKKTMVKFDPLQPEHSKLELTKTEPEKKRKKKGEPVEDETQPDVSKEVFYKVADNLKETFSEKPQISLLSMFGRTIEEPNNDIEQETETSKKLRRNPLDTSRNPFKYDSSDEEDETADIPHKDTSARAPGMTKPVPVPIRNQSVFWTEPFFFKKDDFRLQEGFDFIEKIKGQNKDFSKIRREIKGIVKAKVKNNERKNKMFKKKLGGSKRRKHIRMKKALKRGQ